MDDERPPPMGDEPDVMASPLPDPDMDPETEDPDEPDDDEEVLQRP